MAALALFGFYNELGSIDYPANMSETAKFGFLEGNSTPVFNYSIRDVKNSFNTPRDLITGDSNVLVGTTDACVLTVESGAQVEALNTELEDIKSVFKILHYIYINQSTVGDADVGYNNSGDHVLADDTDPDYVAAYDAGSLVVNDSGSHTGRLKSAIFNVNVNIGEITSIVVTVYFDADDFIERPNGMKSTVYCYEENPNSDSALEDTIKTQVTNLVDIVNAQEFENLIVDVLFNKLKNGVYKRYDSSLIRMMDGGVEKRQQFFVFSNYATDSNYFSVNSDSIINSSIKSYLSTKYSNNTAVLKVMYPDLFTETEVMIIPIYNNVYTEGEISQYVHPVDFDTIVTAITAFGCSLDVESPNYRKTDIFYLGGDESGNLSAANELPLIAVSGAGETTRPIFSRFPYYGPIYNVNYDVGNSDPQKFHHYISVSLGILYDWVTTNVDPVLSASLSMEKISDSGRNCVKFNFANTIWKVYANA